MAIVRHVMLCYFILFFLPSCACARARARARLWCMNHRMQCLNRDDDLPSS